MRTRWCVSICGGSRRVIVWAVLGLACARQREMPGHAVSALAAYPELGVPGDRIDVATRWGVFSDIFNAEPATLAFDG